MRASGAVEDGGVDGVAVWVGHGVAAGWVCGVAECGEARKDKCLSHMNYNMMYDKCVKSFM